MKINPWKVSTMVLCGALALVIGTSAIPEAAAENQPHMRSALAMLEKAKGELQSATSDKGGHRVKAIALTQQAIEETKKGIEYDNKH